MFSYDYSFSTENKNLNCPSSEISSKTLSGSASLITDNFSESEVNLSEGSAIDSILRWKYRFIYSSCSACPSPRSIPGTHLYNPSIYTLNIDLSIWIFVIMGDKDSLQLEREFSVVHYPSSETAAFPSSSGYDLDQYLNVELGDYESCFWPSAQSQV